MACRQDAKHGGLRHGVYGLRWRRGGGGDLVHSEWVYSERVVNSAHNGCKSHVNVSEAIEMPRRKGEMRWIE